MFNQEEFNPGAYPHQEEPAQEIVPQVTSAQPEEIPTEAAPFIAQPEPVILPEPRKKEKRKKRGFGAIIAVALICSILGSILGAAGSLWYIHNTRNPENQLELSANDTPNEGNATTDVHQGQRPDTTIDINQIDTDKLMTPAEVYAAYVESTVGITTSITTNFWGQETTSAASGSGFIISEDGYILTNHHVIEESTAITVSFYDGSSKDAQLIGYDASNDIAVLKVDAKGLKPVVLGNSENMNVGDTVLAIGNPLGELTFSLTVGVVSAKERDVTTSSGVTMALMQTDCAINSGNSGGALFNLYGEVVGITNAKYSTSSLYEASIDNIGFAIPVNNIRSIVKSLIEDGFIAKPYIGVTVTDVSEEMQSYGIPQGAAIQSVTENSPAHKAGLKANDIITHVDDTAIEGSNDLVKIVRASEVDQVLKVKIYRRGQTLELELTVGEQVQPGVANQENK